MQQPDGERRARAEPRPSRQVAMMVNLDAFFDLQPFENAADRRMGYFAGFPYLLDPRPDDAALEVEELRQVAAVQVEVLVDRRRQHSAAMLAEPRRIVGTASEEGDAQRGTGDDHLSRSATVSAKRYGPARRRTGGRRSPRPDGC